MFEEVSLRADLDVTLTCRYIMMRIKLGNTRKIKALNESVNTGKLENGNGPKFLYNQI